MGAVLTPILIIVISALLLFFYWVAKRTIFSDYIWKKCKEELYLFDDKIENRYAYNQMPNISDERDISVKGFLVYTIEFYYKDIKKITYNSYHNRFILEGKFKRTLEGKYLDGKVIKENISDDRYETKIHQGKSLFYMYYEESAELLSEIKKRSNAEFIEEISQNSICKKIRDKEYIY